MAKTVSSDSTASDGTASDTDAADGCTSAGKQVRRHVPKVLANRRSAQRSRERKMEQMGDLEGQVAVVHRQLRAILPELQTLRKHHQSLLAHNAALQKRLQVLQSGGAAGNAVPASGCTWAGPTAAAAVLAAPTASKTSGASSSSGTDAAGNGTLQQRGSISAGDGTGSTPLVPQPAVIPYVRVPVSVSPPPRRPAQVITAQPPLLISTSVPAHGCAGEVSLRGVHIQHPAAEHQHEQAKLHPQQPAEQRQQHHPHLQQQQLQPQQQQLTPHQQDQHSQHQEQLLPNNSIAAMSLSRWRSLMPASSADAALDVLLDAFSTGSYPDVDGEGLTGMSVGAMATANQHLVSSPRALPPVPHGQAASSAAHSPSLAAAAADFATARNAAKRMFEQLPTVALPRPPSSDAVAYISTGQGCGGGQAESPAMQRQIDASRRMSSSNVTQQGQAQMLHHYSSDLESLLEHAMPFKQRQQQQQQPGALLPQQEPRALQQQQSQPYPLPELNAASNLRQQLESSFPAATSADLCMSGVAAGGGGGTDESRYTAAATAAPAPLQPQGGSSSSTRPASYPTSAAMVGPCHPSSHYPPNQAYYYHQLPYEYHPNPSAYGPYPYPQSMPSGMHPGGAPYPSHHLRPYPTVSMPTSYASYPHYELQPLDPNTAPPYDTSSARGYPYEVQHLREYNPHAAQATHGVAGYPGGNHVHSQAQLVSCESAMFAGQVRGVPTSAGNFLRVSPSSGVLDASPAWQQQQQQRQVLMQRSASATALVGAGTAGTPNPATAARGDGAREMSASPAPAPLHRSAGDNAAGMPSQVDGAGVGQQSPFALAPVPHTAATTSRADAINGAAPDSAAYAATAHLVSSPPAGVSSGGRSPRYSPVPARHHPYAPPSSHPYYHPAQGMVPGAYPYYGQPAYGSPQPYTVTRRSIGGLPTNGMLMYGHNGDGRSPHSPTATGMMDIYPGSGSPYVHGPLSAPAVMAAQDGVGPGMLAPAPGSGPLLIRRMRSPSNGGITQPLMHPHAHSYAYAHVMPAGAGPPLMALHPQPAGPGSGGSVRQRVISDAATAGTSPPPAAAWQGAGGSSSQRLMSATGNRGREGSTGAAAQMATAMQGYDAAGNAEAMDRQEAGGPSQMLAVVRQPSGQASVDMSSQR